MTTKNRIKQLMVAFALAFGSICAAPLGAVAAGSITVQGNAILKDGKPWIARGVSIDSFVFSDQGMVQKYGDAELKAISEYGADTIRFPFNENSFDPQSPSHTPKKFLLYIDAVRLARSRGFTVIVVAYRPQTNPPPEENKLPTDVDIRAWQNVAPQLQSDPGIMFELFNEPAASTQDASDQPWGDWQAAHQRVLDAIRATGAKNVIIADGFKWGHLVAGAPALNDPVSKVIYAVHPYPNTHYDTRPEWDAAFGQFSTENPVLITEWNARAAVAYCFPTMPQVANNFLTYVKEHHIGISAWSFDTPDALRNADGTLTNFDNFACGTKGQAVGQLLHRYFTQQ